MDYVSGDILTVEGFQKGYVSTEEHTVFLRDQRPSHKTPIARGLIVPTFVNAHTHVGDTFIRKRALALPCDVEQLVQPPDGLKHRLLRTASDEEIIAGMAESINEMKTSGVSMFCDFREGGILGCDLLHRALQNQHVSSLILSRPREMFFDSEEMNHLLKTSDGIGLSGIADYEYSEMVKIAKYVKTKGKMLGLHASERVREDIDTILDLKPDFLVHMVKATESDFMRVKDNGIPVVICARSNHFFGLRPRYELMKKTDVSVLIGTDNAMTTTTSILDEIIFIQQQTTVFSLTELLFSSTYLARKALNLKDSIPGLPFPASFLVLNRHTLEPEYLFLSGEKG